MNFISVLKKAKDDQSAGTLVLVMIFIPIAILLLGMVIDIARIYNYRIAHQGFSRSAAEAGITVVGDEMKQIIQEKIDKAESKGGSYTIQSPVWRNLDNKDRQRLISAAVAQGVRSRAHDYLMKNVDRNPKMIQPLNVHIIYPYSTSNEVSVRVEYEIAVPYMFMKDGKKLISIQNEATMQISD